MSLRHSFACLLLAATSAAFAGDVVEIDGVYRFREDFAWQGNHAARVNGGSGSTVWWDEASWDTRGDSSFTAVMPMAGGAMTNRFHIDIHKAASSDPRDGRVDNSSPVVGGDGSAGVGIMHLDFQDIVSARLRNPLLIGDGGATLRFHAPAFNTSGHWWEIAITPADRMIAGEYTGVPGQDPYGLPDGSGGGSVGPGHGPYADSINLVMIGSSDVPCIVGWRVRSGITRTVAGATSHYVNPVASQSEYLQTDPAQAQTLVLWQIDYRRDGITLSVDLDGDGSVTAIESWALDVPWSEVHVHLLGVAYQADHHPQEPCYLGHMREIGWRAIEAWPVKFARTDVHPSNQGIVQTPRALGFMGYDLRDIQRLGPAEEGAASPANDAPYLVSNAGRWCNDAGYPCFRADAAASLAFELPARFTAAREARLLLDTKDRAQADASLSARLNGVALGRFGGHDRVAAAEASAWVRDALPVPLHALGVGDASLELTLEAGAYADRIEFEFGFAGALEDRIFRDSFGPQLFVKQATAARDWRHPMLGTLQTRPLFGVAEPAHCRP